MTRYIVFKRDSRDGSRFDLIGTAEGHDAKGAISAVIAEMDDEEKSQADGVTFAATPAASWKPLVVSVQVETKVRIA